MCSTDTFMDSTIVTTEDSSSITNDSTISSPEWTTTLPELTFDNGNDENGDIKSGKNKNASKQEDWNEETPEAKAGEKADTIEKNKATTHPFAIFTDAGDALILGEKSPENSTFAKVMMGKK